MWEKLKEYDLMLCLNESPDSKPIDIVAYDDEDDVVASMYGDSPTDSIQVECTHPSQCVEFDDDEPVGWCALCGASCDCHYELDEGNVEDYFWSGRRLVPTEWTTPKKPGGIFGEYLKELQARE